MPTLTRCALTFTLVLTGVLFCARWYLAQFPKPRQSVETGPDESTRWRPSKSVYFRCGGNPVAGGAPLTGAGASQESDSTSTQDERAGSQSGRGAERTKPRGTLDAAQPWSEPIRAGVSGPPDRSGAETDEVESSEGSKGRATSFDTPESTRIKVDDGLLNYQPVAGISGSLTVVGSDSFGNLMEYWQEGFKKHYPDVQFAVEGKGSTTAPPALIDGTADLGPMSREMKAEEISKFEDRFGYKPTKIAVAIDALAVFVNKDNPVQALSLEQLDAVFSGTRKRGYPVNLKEWGQVLPDAGKWQGIEMTLYGRNSASGSYGFFKEQALKKGDFKETVQEQPASSTVVAGIELDPSGIGYASIGYLTAGVKPLALAAKHGGPAYWPTPASCYDGKYPLARYLYIYVNKTPEKELSPLIREFLKFILSREGQEIVLKDGLVPLTKKMVDSNSKLVK